MYKYTILGPYSERSAVSRAVFREVGEGRVPDAAYFGVDALFGGTRLIGAALTSRKLKTLMEKHGVLRRLFGRAYEAALRAPRRITLRKLGGHPTDTEPRYIIFCPSTNIDRVSPATLDALRRACPRCRLIFYLVDGVERTAVVNNQQIEDVLAYLDHFDAVYTYDRTDAERYSAHMCFIEIPMWRSNAQAPAAPEYDLYFCGRDKKRRELLLAIHDRLASAGLRCRMHIVGATEATGRPGIVSGSWIPYEETVADALRANCVLEVLADYNQESTLRYKEAVIYNKKLLTNNPHIAALPYYDPRWMRTFQSVDDIDLDWLRSVEPVDYGYRGDYSAEAFLKRVEEAFECNHGKAR